jgi:hypothetical protein
MPRKRKVTLPARPVDWEVTTSFTWNGRHIEPGTELSITGEPGARFRFIQHVRTPTAEWVDVAGGTKRSGIRNRSFRPDRIKTVHRKPKMPPSRAA